MYDIKEIRKHFPMLNGNKKMQGKPLVFLDNASTTFKPQCVIDAMDKYYTEMSVNSHRGDYDLSFVVDEEIRKSRETVAKFVNCDFKEVVFTSGDTQSLNLVAYAYGLQFLKEGDEIVVSEAEHASNLLPWFRVSQFLKAKIVYIPLDEEGKVTEENLLKVMNNRTKVVSLAHVTNVMGFKINIQKIDDTIREYKLRNELRNEEGDTISNFIQLRHYFVHHLGSKEAEMFLQKSKMLFNLKLTITILILYRFGITEIKFKPFFLHLSVFDDCLTVG